MCSRSFGRSVGRSVGQSVALPFMCRHLSRASLFLSCVHSWLSRSPHVLSCFCRPCVLRSSISSSFPVAPVRFAAVLHFIVSLELLPSFALPFLFHLVAASVSFGLALFVYFGLSCDFKEYSGSHVFNFVTKAPSRGCVLESSLNRVFGAIAHIIGRYKYHLTKGCEDWLVSSPHACVRQNASSRKDLPVQVSRGGSSSGHAREKITRSSKRLVPTFEGATCRPKSLPITF